MSGLAEFQAIGDDAAAPAAEPGNIARLAPGIFLSDLRLQRSADGQHLLILCDEEAVAIYGPMGPSVAVVEFADGGRFTVESLLDLLADG